MPLEISEKLKSTEWKDKKEAFLQLNTWINENLDKLKSLNEHIFRYIKAKMKDWKESNINLLKETFPIIINLIKNPDINFTK